MTKLYFETVYLFWVYTETRPMLIRETITVA
jgi:hypothetical protein